MSSRELNPLAIPVVSEASSSCHLHLRANSVSSSDSGRQIVSNSEFILSTMLRMVGKFENSVKGKDVISIYSFQ